MVSLLVCVVLSSLPRASALVGEIEIQAVGMSLAVFVFLLCHLRFDSAAR